LKLAPKAQSKAFDHIKKLGIYEYNKTILHTGSDKKLLRERNTPKCRNSPDNNDMTVCSSCQGYFSRAYMYRHKHECSGSRPGESFAIQAIPVSVIAAKTVEPDSEFAKYLLSAFRKNSIGNLCRSDEMIRIVGKHQWDKNVKNNKKGPMRDMRRLATIVLACQEVVSTNANGSTPLKQNKKSPYKSAKKRKSSSPIKTDSNTFTGADIFERTNFDIVLKALNNMTASGKNGEPKHSLKIGLCYVLKAASQTIRATYLTRGEDAKAESVQIFQVILDIQWSSMMNKSQFALQLKSQEILRKPIELPLESDVALVKEYTLKTIKALLKKKGEWTTYEFNRLRALLVCRLTLFNARRGGEPARLLIRQWREAEAKSWIDLQAAARLKKLDRALIGKYMLTYLPGKNRKLVPILFPSDCIKAIQKLMLLRSSINGISPDNMFLFPSTRRTLTGVIGTTCIAEVCSYAGVDKIERMTATKIRHRASTVYAMQDVPENERDIFYKHMGHSKATNANIYQNPQGINEILLVGKHLQNMDNGGERELVDSSSSDEYDDIIDDVYGANFNETGFSDED
jgi:hypothetical protein